MFNLAKNTAIQHSNQKISPTPKNVQNGLVSDLCKELILKVESALKNSLVEVAVNQILLRKQLSFVHLNVKFSKGHLTVVKSKSEDIEKSMSRMKKW